MVTSTYAGKHRFDRPDEDDIFVVFRVNNDWYWQQWGKNGIPRGRPIGPFISDEDAYTNAMRS